jgi:hypothetical protein
MRLWRGGRLDIRPTLDGTTQVQLTGGRSAHQINKQQVYLICGDCGEDVLIQRRDGQPLSSSDITEALGTWAHTCVETT